VEVVHAWSHALAEGMHHFAGQSVEKGLMAAIPSGVPLGAEALATVLAVQQKAYHKGRRSVRDTLPRSQIALPEPPGTRWTTLRPLHSSCSAWLARIMVTEGQALMTSDLVQVERVAEGLWQMVNGIVGGGLEAHQAWLALPDAEKQEWRTRPKW
jgi:hypothetical protein